MVGSLAHSCGVEAARSVIEGGLALGCYDGLAHVGVQCLDPVYLERWLSKALAV